MMLDAPANHYTEIERDLDELNIAILLPCYNEAAAIGATIEGFRKHLPQARIFVYDNNSSDATAAVAAQHGAVVRKETRQGKGNVVRRMFADVEADVYVLADGDGTYDAASARDLIQLLCGGPYDVINGGRLEQSRGAYRPGHRFGNWMLTTLVRISFNASWTDMLSGYKVMSRRFVKSFPIASGGFEIETELFIHAMEVRAASTEVACPYFERGEGSTSKLNTFRDGFRILRMIGVLIKDERPLQFFSATAAAFVLLALIIAWPVFAEFARTGLVPRFPTAILATGLVLAGMLSQTAGFVLDGIARTRRETKRLFFLRYPSV
jgi:glycosyltransferase involved in cell wall biosynthesis